MTSTASRSSAGAADITAAASASFADCPNPRLREIMQALVHHLHAFVTEVNLTEDEWTSAIQILTATGHITDERRQEFILWSDALGVSMLVDELAHPDANGATESTVLGPFWTPDAPRREYGASIAEQAGGTPALVRGRVLDPAGMPVAGAELDIWQNGDNGLYTVQDDSAPEAHLRGRFTSRADGSYAFIGVRPVPYTIPHDGPVGAMLDATRRHPWRPAHIHMIVTAPGYQRLQTHIFDSRSAYLDSDAVFAVKPSLIREFQPRSAGDPETPVGIVEPWCLVDNDIVLHPLAAS
ncbi:MAG TPA: dioxygenase [Chloroflexota bacterium]